MKLLPGAFGALGRATIGLMGEGGEDDDDRTLRDRRRQRRRPRKRIRTGRRK